MQTELETLREENRQLKELLCIDKYMFLPREWKLGRTEERLVILLYNAGVSYNSCTNIMIKLHGFGYEFNDHAARMMIYKIRKKLGRDFVQVVSNVGYRLSLEARGRVRANLAIVKKGYKTAKYNPSITE